MLKKYEEVKTALAHAEEFAEQQRIPLTFERIALCLNADRAEICDIARGGDAAKLPDKSRRLIVEACRLSCAQIVELGLQNKGSASMVAFILKNNAGYVDKPDGELKSQQILFINEHKIMD